MPQLCAFSGVHSEHRACSCYRQRGKEPVSCTSAWISSGCIGSVPKSKQCWLKIKWKLLETHLEIDSSTTHRSHISHHSKFGSRPHQIFPPLGVSLVPRVQPVQTERHRWHIPPIPTLSPSNAERFHVTHEASGRRRIGGVKERPRALGSCNQRHRMTSV